jgi:hypothetical protein
MYQTTTLTEWHRLLNEQCHLGTAGEVVGPWLAHSIASITRNASHEPRPSPAGRVATDPRTPKAGGEHARLGAAVAAPIWGWAHPPQDGAQRASVTTPEDARHGATTAPGRTELPMSAALLRAMAEAARATGRPERDVWAEAAREWLQRHIQSDDPQPPEPGAAAHHPIELQAARERCWQAIDVLVSDLRAPQPACPATYPDREEPAA